MEDQTDKKTDCGCSDGCCAPPKKKPWAKILFFLVILAAASIITIKLTTKSSGNVPQSVRAADSTKNMAADSLTADCSKTCDPSKSSCCPENKK